MWRPYIPFAALGAALPLALVLFGEQDLQAVAATALVLGAFAGALFAAPILAAVAARRPVWAAVATLAFPLGLFAGYAGALVLWNGPAGMLSAYLLATAYLPYLALAGLLTWAVYHWSA